MTIEDPTRELGIGEIAHPNGQTPAPVTPIRSPLNVPGRNVREFRLPHPYLGYAFEAWTNYPGKLADDISSEDRRLRLAAFSRIFVSHNSWPDTSKELDPETGRYPALPQWGPDDLQSFEYFWETIAQELRLAMQAEVGVEVGNFAMEVQERKRRR